MTAKKEYDRASVGRSNEPLCSLAEGNNSVTGCGI